MRQHSLDRHVRFSLSGVAVACAAVLTLSACGGGATSTRAPTTSAAGPAPTTAQTVATTATQPEETRRTRWLHSSERARLAQAGEWIHEHPTPSAIYHGQPDTSSALVAETDRFYSDPTKFVEGHPPSEESDREKPEANSLLAEVFAYADEIISTRRNGEVETKNSAVPTRQVIGMTKSAVEAGFGRPQHTQEIGGQVIWYYYRGTNSYQLIFSGETVQEENKY
jgi:hypothetical protein